MRYLLDTHTLVWYFDNSPKLPRKIEELIDNPEADMLISSASLWEITIKLNLGKLDLNLSLKELLDIIRTRDFDILQIENDYL